MKIFSKEDLCLLVGQNVRKIRLARHTTIDHLAFELGIEYTQLSRIERGVINTSIFQIYTIAKILKVPVAELFEEVPSRILE